jgi:hypothetical protein
VCVCVCVRRACVCVCVCGLPSASRRLHASGSHLPSPQSKSAASPFLSPTHLTPLSLSLPAPRAPPEKGLPHSRGRDAHAQALHRYAAAAQARAADKEKAEEQVASGRGRVSRVREACVHVRVREACACVCVGVGVCACVGMQAARERASEQQAAREKAGAGAGALSPLQTQHTLTLTRTLNSNNATRDARWIRAPFHSLLDTGTFSFTAGYGHLFIHCWIRAPFHSLLDTGTFSFTVAGVAAWPPTPASPPIIARRKKPSAWRGPRRSCRRRSCCWPPCTARGACEHKCVNGGVGGGGA